MKYSRYKGYGMALIGATLWGSAEPLLATIVTIFWLHVSLGMFELLGGICIICTVLILTLGENYR